MPRISWSSATANSSRINSASSRTRVGSDSVFRMSQVAFTRAEGEKNRGSTQRPKQGGELPRAEAGDDHAGREVEHLEAAVLKTTAQPAGARAEHEPPRRGTKENSQHQPAA